MRLNLTRLHWSAALEQVLQGPNVLPPDGWGQRSQSKSLSTQLFDKVTLSFAKYLKNKYSIWKIILSG